MSFQNSISGKEFCRRNCRNVGKEKFYEEYYRIIHTAYLRSNGSPCIDVIRNDFADAFGAELDNISVSYILATAKYFVYDVIVSSLLGDGKLDSQYYYNKLAIDLGFDVWLIKSIEEGSRLTMGDFTNFQPLSKTDRTDRQINDFWHFKLPKSHNFGHLYQGIAPFKQHIFETYYKLLNSNADFDNDPAKLAAVLEYLRGELEKMKPVEEKAEDLASDVAKVMEEEQAEASAEVERCAMEAAENSLDTAKAALEEKAVNEQAVADTKEAVEAAFGGELAEKIEESFNKDIENTLTKEVEESKTDEIFFEEDLLDEEPMTGETKVDELPEYKPEPKPMPVIRLVEPKKEETKAEKLAPAKPVNKQVKGFKDGRFAITKEKVITAAVCLALAGTLVVPIAIALGKGRRKK